jgi:pimeloyl-ACP methyl ester carboxylesterase
MHTESVGSPDAPAVVFLHGVATSGWMWWQQVPAFPDHLRLVVDLPGHGRSRDVPWVSLADAARQVAEVIRARTATGRAHVVGLSLGGQIALSLLEHHPEVVDRAVISGVTVEPWPGRLLIAAQAWLTTSALRSRRLVTAQAHTFGLPPEVESEFVANALAMRPGTYRRIVAEVARYRLAGALAGVRAPTLVVAGGNESDMIKNAVTAIPAVMPDAAGRLVPDVGHGWNVEAPERFNDTVREWISTR